MRLLAVVALSAVALIVGCGRDEDSSSPRKAPDTSSGGPAQTSGGPASSGGPATVSAALTACSAVTEPKQLADVKDADEVNIAGTAVFYRSGLSVLRTLKDGTGKKTVFTSPNLVRVFVDKKGLLLVEQTAEGNPTATLRGFTANLGADPNPDDDVPPPETAFPEFPVAADGAEPGADPGGTTAATNFNAPSAQVFGADATNYYLLADDNNNGNALIVAVNRTTLAQTTIVNVDQVVTNPILANNAIWYVQEGQRIKMVQLATDDQAQGEATEVFGLGQCNLAVSDSSAFCSVGATIETRDLKGSNAKTLIAAAQSKSQAPFGVANWFDGRLYVRSGAPDAEVQHFIRAISADGADESFVACKRDMVTDIAADATDLVWAEAGKGVFMVAAKK